MTTPASFPQVNKFYVDALGQPSSEKTQYLLANGDLFRALADAPDLSKVDRGSFKALLVPAPKSIDWTPAEQYGDKLREWKDHFGFKITDAAINELTAKLPAHAGSHQPTSIELTFGKGLQHDWKVVMQVLEYELGKLGVPFTDYIEQNKLTVSYYQGCTPAKVKKPTLDMALLDIGMFWDPQNGIMPREVRRQRDRWPGLELAWLLALNPQVFLAMDGETVPYMWATGLVVGSGDLPCFGRGSGEAFGVYWGGGRWRGYSVVAFRES